MSKSMKEEELHLYLKQDLEDFKQTYLDNELKGYLIVALFKHEDGNTYTHEYLGALSQREILTATDRMLQQVRSDKTLH